MDSTPDAMFVVDVSRAQRHRRSPQTAHPDRGAGGHQHDPELVDYPIAGNDDAIKAIQVIADAIGETITSQGVQAAATDEASRRSRPGP